MKKIVHISDLHFGTEKPDILSLLFDELNSINPDVVVVSGDLTQRAKTKQFIKAKSFINRVDFPLVIIPGNHDIPLYNIWERVTNPFAKFESYFDKSDRYYSDDQLQIIGLNSVRNLRWKSGRISSEELEIADSQLKEFPKKTVKILTFHHNLLHISSQRNAVKLFKTKLMHDWLMQNGIDLVLFGHDHRPMVQPILFDEDNTFDFILIQAGTTISKRTRGFPNSFNLINISDFRCEILIKEIIDQEFEIVATHQFAKISGGWTNP